MSPRSSPESWASLRLHRPLDAGLPRWRRQFRSDSPETCCCPAWGRSRDTQISSPTRRTSNRASVLLTGPVQHCSTRPDLAVPISRLTMAAASLVPFAAASPCRPGRTSARSTATSRSSFPGSQQPGCSIRISPPACASAVTLPVSGLLPLPQGLGAFYIPVHNPNSYVDSWNFTIEHQLAT